MSAAQRARARRGEGEKLRDEIVAAGRQLLFDAGEEAVTIRAVANAVGVSPPSIYLHFADKNALLVAICESTFEALDDHIEEAIAGVDDLREELRLRGRAYVEFGLQNPEQYRILFMQRPLIEFQGLPAPSAFEHHLDAVYRAWRSGLFPEHTDPHLAALTLWAGVHGITSLLIAKPDFPWPDRDVFIDHLQQALLDGLSYSSRMNES